MHSTWDESQKRVAEINKLWEDSQAIWVTFSKARQLAATELEDLLKEMVDAATKLYNVAPSLIRCVPMIREQKMIGLKIWVGDNCNIFNVPEEKNEKNKLGKRKKRNHESELGTSDGEDASSTSE